MAVATERIKRESWRKEKAIESIEETGDGIPALAKRNGRTIVSEETTGAK